MRSIFATALMLCATSVVSAQGKGAASQIAAKNGWLTDLGQAKTLAQKTGKPIFLVFRCEP